MVIRCLENHVFSPSIINFADNEAKIHLTQNAILDYTHTQTCILAKICTCRAVRNIQ